MGCISDKQLRRVCVVGPSTRFLSGITYYTFDLATAFAHRYETSAILMRRLLPRRLYPGHARVGAKLTDVSLPEKVRSFDGVDWFWGSTMWRAARFLRREKPEVVVFQWWTATVLHSYILLAVMARIRGARVVVEFHEVLDPGEQRLRGPFLYARFFGRFFFRLGAQYVVHSEADRALVLKHFNLPAAAIAVVPHAAYRPRGAKGEMHREAPIGVCNLLYFGVIRNYKGLDLLVRAFSELPREEAEKYWLTIVGETWEHCTLPAELIAASPHRDRITFVNRYVDDDELEAFVKGADVVVLPYRRSSQSGPLHLAMGCGLPVVVTSVGGLVEAVADYEGAVVVEPANVADLTNGIQLARKMVARDFSPPFDWHDTLRSYDKIIAS
jgi:glycosyltransferase involved in cell wall biosynthesis